MKTKLNTMKIKLNAYFLAFPLALGILASGCATSHPPVKRVGMVIGVRPDKIAAYEAFHADSNPGVRDLLDKYHMHDFSIFIQQIGDKWYEFGYYEYTGTNYDEDMAKLAKEPRNIAWLKQTDPLQIPLNNSKGWTMMKRVYFNP